MKSSVLRVSLLPLFVVRVLYGAELYFNHIKLSSQTGGGLLRGTDILITTGQLSAMTTANIAFASYVPHCLKQMISPLFKSK